jgi:hypothetical protein
MFRIRYAARVVVDARGDDAPIKRAAIRQDTFARFADIDHAVMQAVNDLHHDKIVLGIEDEKSGKVVVDSIVLHVKLGQARERMRLMEAQGFGPKRARQLAVREVRRG